MTTLILNNMNIGMIKPGSIIAFGSEFSKKHYHHYLIIQVHELFGTREIAIVKFLNKFSRIGSVHLFQNEKIFLLD